eukprot:XP_011682485.1 PREDICTED: uncharacterized protein LOC105446847 [Strongylocentrotus purpuratus]
MTLAKEIPHHPTGLQLKSSISTPRAKLIIHKAGQALVRERIANTRHQLHTMEKDIQTSEVNLSQLLEPADLRKCQAFKTSTAGKTFQSTRQKQIVKFNKFLANRQKSTNQTTPISTKDTVINLSNHLLTETEHKVLSLGLNFALSPKKIPFSEVIQQVEPKLRFLSRTAADQIRFQVTQALSTAKPPQPNISKPERAAIKDLRSNQSIHILQADKGNATVLLNKGDYNNKIGALLETPTYKKLKKDPTLVTERKLNQRLLSLQRTEVISKPLYFKLRSSSATCPILFGQPKIHTPTIPLRPIISTRGSPRTQPMLWTSQNT